MILNACGGGKNLELITSRESDVGVVASVFLLVWLIVIRKERNSIKMCRFIKENGTPPFGMLVASKVHLSYWLPPTKWLLEPKMNDWANRPYGTKTPNIKGVKKWLHKYNLQP